MQIILIGILAFTVVAVMEALVYTLRFVTDRRKDELKRRLSSLGTADAKAVTGLLRKGKLSAIPAIDAFLRSIKLTARIENILEQTELEITVARLLRLLRRGRLPGADPRSPERRRSAVDHPGAPVRRAAVHVRARSCVRGAAGSSPSSSPRRWR